MRPRIRRGPQPSGEATRLGSALEHLLDVAQLGRLLGFTRWRRTEVQLELDILPLIAPEAHVLLTAPLVRAFGHRSRLGLSVTSAFRLSECLTS